MTCHGQLPSLHMTRYMTNHWIHRMNDKYIYGMHGFVMNGLHDTTIDDQPYPHSYMCRS